MRDRVELVKAGGLVGLDAITHPHQDRFAQVDDVSRTDLYASEVPSPRGLLDPVLRAVADDILAAVMIAPGDLSWIYHPYDGGADVLLPTSEQRDQLRERHRDWLSAHPAGL